MHLQLQTNVIYLHTSKKWKPIKATQVCKKLSINKINKFKKKKFIYLPVNACLWSVRLRVSDAAVKRACVRVRRCESVSLWLSVLVWGTEGEAGAGLGFVYIYIYIYIYTYIYIERERGGGGNAHPFELSATSQKTPSTFIIANLLLYYSYLPN